MGPAVHHRLQRELGARQEFLLQCSGLLLRVQAAVPVLAHLYIHRRLWWLRLQPLVEPTQVLVLGDLLALVPFLQLEERFGGEVAACVLVCQGGALDRRPGRCEPAGDYATLGRRGQRHRGGGALSTERARLWGMSILYFGMQRGGEVSPPLP